MPRDAETDARLDRPIWHALTTSHAGLSEGNARARHYRLDYARFAATLDDSADSLAALHDIVPAGEAVALFTLSELAFPASLNCVRRAPMLQMALERDPGTTKLPAGARTLNAPDLPAMTALVELTHPGPFAARTPEMGHYIGVFDGGTLVAMAGERMRLTGAVEISAVCTHPEHTGNGLAGALVNELARLQLAAGEAPFLHVFADNAGAIALYRKLGFAVRAEMHLSVVKRADPPPP